MTKENLYNAKEAAAVYHCAKDKREAIKRVMAGNYLDEAGARALIVEGGIAPEDLPAGDAIKKEVPRGKAGGRKAAGIAPKKTLKKGANVVEQFNELLEAMKERRKELLEELGAIDRCLQAVAAAAAEDDE